MHRAALLAAVLVLGPLAAHADEAPACAACVEDHTAAAMVGISGPEGATLGLTLGLGGIRRIGPVLGSRGPTFEVEAGVRGGALLFGAPLPGPLPTLFSWKPGRVGLSAPGFALKGMVLRTWRDSGDFVRDATYVGPQLQLAVLRVGHLWQMNGPGKGWTVGVSLGIAF